MSVVVDEGDGVAGRAASGAARCSEATVWRLSLATAASDGDLGASLPALAIAADDLSDPLEGPRVPVA